LPKDWRDAVDPVANSSLDCRPVGDADQEQVYTLVYRATDNLPNRDLTLGGKRESEMAVGALKETREAI
jgi:hypothetical protein